MATPQEQRRRLEEQRKRQQAQQQSSKPPAVGTKRADGKIYSGQNYGYQSPATHTKLKNEGKFKAGAQALDRATQSVSRVIPQPIKNYAKGVAAEGARQQQTKDRVLQRAGVNTNKPDATQRVLKGISDKTNVDQRIVNTAANVAQAAISKRALRGAKPQAASKPVPRSVGAAGKPAPVRRELPKVNRPGTVANKGQLKAPPKPATSQPTASAPQGRNVNLGNIQRGAKKFTPATRAQAVQRANTRPIKQRNFESRSNEAIGVTGTKGSSKHRDGTSHHNIAFAHSGQKQAARGMNDSYASRRELGEAPKSKGRERLRTAGLKDMMGRMLDVDQFDSVTAQPTTRSRGILYNRASKGALGVRRGNADVDSVRVGPNMWINNADGGKRVKFDPKTLREPLTKQTKTKATRVGKAAGGTSKKAALVKGAPKNVIRDSKADRQDTKARWRGANAKRAEASKRREKLAAEARRANGLEIRRGTTVRNRPGVVRSTRGSRVSQLRRSEAQISEQASTARRQSNNRARDRMTAAQAAASDRARRQFRAQDEMTRSREGQRATSGGAIEMRRIRPAPSRGTDVRSRQGVVRTNQRSRVSNDQRQRVREGTQDANINANMSRPRTAREERMVRRFLRQDADTRDRGGRRTWNGTKETMRIKRRRR